ncbi:MAG: ABC transporter ATP-binding protein [Clostridiales bacterium]|jgi:putative ABC transport system ATP-binding protein|nr:ABC transporter ATP-binding protein [Clostridiales bacterium]MDR2752620.1 ABC transporter ATP-binding protein [Clostridiales bacterium]
MSNSQDKVIQMSGICKSYGKSANKVTALSDITFDVYRGEFVAILGPSGSGKTTLMNIIGLMDSADSGQYLLDGEDVTRAKEKVSAKLRNAKIGFVFQKFNLIPKYNALYNVALPLMLQGKSYKEAQLIAKEMLDRVGLGERVKHKPSELSGGQAQRVAIARALVGDCSLILADEPTGALDQKTGHEALDFMQSLNAEGKTIVMITHDVNIASRARRVVRVEDGRLAV